MAQVLFFDIFSKKEKIRILTLIPLSILMLSEDKRDTLIIHVNLNDIMNGIYRDDLILQIGRVGLPNINAF